METKERKKLKEKVWKYMMKKIEANYSQSSTSPKILIWSQEDWSTKEYYEIPFIIDELTREVKEKKRGAM